MKKREGGDSSSPSQDGGNGGELDSKDPVCGG